MLELWIHFGSMLNGYLLETYLPLAKLHPFSSITFIIISCLPNWADSLKIYQLSQEFYLSLPWTDRKLLLLNLLGQGERPLCASRSHLICHDFILVFFCFCFLISFAMNSWQVCFWCLTSFAMHLWQFCLCCRIFFIFVLPLLPHLILHDFTSDFAFVAPPHLAWFYGSFALIIITLPADSRRRCLDYTWNGHTIQWPTSSPKFKEQILQRRLAIVSPHQCHE